MLHIQPVEKSSYRAFYARMKRDFPRNELPPFFAVKRNLRKKVYTALYLYDDGQEVGYAVLTAPAGFPFALITYLAVSPECRSKGYGSSLLKLLDERFAGQTLVLEAESPEAAKTEDERLIRERRIQFYERAGFRVVPTARAKIFGVAMAIMVNAPGDIGSVREMMRALYRPSLPSARWLRFIDVMDV